MFYDLCNTGHEGHIDTFYRMAVIDAAMAPWHNEFTSVAQLQQLFGNINEAADVLAIDFLPNQAQVSHNGRNGDDGRQYNTRASFIVTPQTATVQQIMEAFNNLQVVLVVYKRKNVHIYGTKDEPLDFSYTEVNGNAPGSLKGFNVNISGTGLQKARYIQEVELSFTKNKLSFKLAAKL